jgi:hypothetical protein
MPTKPPTPAGNWPPSPCAAKQPTRPEPPYTDSGLTGTVAVTGGTTVTVNVRDTYPTTVLGIIGITSMTVTGHGQARITRSVEGVEQ